MLESIKHFFKHLFKRDYSVTFNEETKQLEVFRCKGCNQTYQEAQENLEWLKNPEHT